MGPFQSLGYSGPPVAKVRGGERRIVVERKGEVAKLTRSSPVAKLIRAFPITRLLRSGGVRRI